MDGVTILSEMSVRGVDLWAVIAVVILTITAIVMKVWDCVEQWNYSGFGTRLMDIILTLALGAVMSVMTVALCDEYNTFHTEYKVTIDDSVGFNEFMGCYEILSNDGDVYTVIDRQVD